MFAKFVAVTCLWVFAMVLGIGVMIYGWGLAPVSWWWIIGGGVAGRIILETFAILTKRSKDD